MTSTQRTPSAEEKRRAFDLAPTAVIPRSPRSQERQGRIVSPHGYEPLLPGRVVARWPDWSTFVSAEHPSPIIRGGVFCTGGSRRTLSMVALPSSRSAGCVRSGDMRLDQPSPVALGGTTSTLLDAADHSPAADAAR